ncbi:C-reactive protein-like [Embiotoca jacksoni]|uniref:C-reactive protein-like n=1 Tax=Embiotoca jacksoni TaxID=100190 RepID=UPI0037047F8F
MEKLVLLSVMLATCFAAPQDLSGKVFIFPKETNKDHVKLITSRNGFSAMTVCLRYLTDLNRQYSLFSLATPTHDNDFEICKAKNSAAIIMHARNAVATFQSLTLPPNDWHAVCGTWQSENGLAQVWVDGKPTIKRYIHSGEPISGATSSILGQEQDTHGGGFHISQAFIGMITKVHAWDHVLSDQEFKRYMDDSGFTPGNVYNWRNLEYEIQGQIYLENEPIVM